MSNDKNMKAFFLYRIYNGQTEDLYAGPWIHSTKVPIGSNGDFQVIIDGLKRDFNMNLNLLSNTTSSKYRVIRRCGNNNIFRSIF